MEHSPSRKPALFYRAHSSAISISKAADLQSLRQQLMQYKDKQPACLLSDMPLNVMGFLFIDEREDIGRAQQIGYQSAD
jgi:hypothetical protein